MKHKGLTVTILLVGLLAVLFVVGMAGEALGAWDVYQAQAQARAAEARARELEARAVIIRERQAMIQTVIVSFASAKDSLLVTVSYLIGGLALFAALVVIGVLLWERGKEHEQA